MCSLRKYPTAGKTAETGFFSCVDVACALASPEEGGALQRGWLLRTAKCDQVRYARHVLGKSQ